MSRAYRDLEVRLDNENAPNLEEVFSIECGGGGNYFLSDHVKGVSIRLTSELYWTIVKQCDDLINLVKLHV